MKKTQMIKGQLVKLRPVKQKDFLFLYKWINHPNAMPFWYGRDRPRSKAWIKKHFSPIIKGENPSSCWIIEVRGKPIGLIYNTTSKNDDNEFTGQVELDILIGEVEKWSKGYGTDALKTMVQYCFAKQNAQRVWLTPNQSNQRAIHLYEKIGFKKEGILRRYEKFEGKWINSIMMSIIKPEWEKGLKA